MILSEILQQIETGHALPCFHIEEKTVAEPPKRLGPGALIFVAKQL